MRIKRFFAGTVVVVLLLVVALSIPSFGQTNPTSRLRYAQVANGLLGNNATYVTTLLVSNINNFTVYGYIDSFDHDNPANPMGLGFTTNCTVDLSTAIFTIPRYSSCLFTSSGSGTLKTGWLRVTESDTQGNQLADWIGGYLAYTLWQGNQFTGYPISTVGVSPTPIYDQFSIPVIRNASTNTDIGFAIVNPFGSGGSVTMNAQLVDTNGTIVEQHDITLNELEHNAKFLSEIFTTLTSANSFVGTLYLTAYLSGDGVIATALMRQGDQYGGAPLTTMSVLAAKQANASTMREDGGMVREREKISSVPGPAVF
jgi:hypothetical protein